MMQKIKPQIKKIILIKKKKMKKILLFLLVFILSANLNAQEDPLVEKIKNIKELYEMNVISKKEYDSITNILVKDLLNKESKSSIKPEEVNLSTSNPQNNSFDSETPINNNLIQNNEDEYIPFIENSWGLSVGYSLANGNLKGYGLTEDFKGNSWSIGFVNRWGSGDNVKWQIGFSYGQSKLTEYEIDGITITSSDFDYYDIDTKSSAIGISLQSLLYFEPTYTDSYPAGYAIIGVGASNSLEEKIDDVKQLNFSAGLGVGVDLDSFTSFSLGYSRILTNPYRGGQLSDVKYNQGSISISAILRF